jgi:bifunctional non-homologous end joining protein LigD
MRTQTLYFREGKSDKVYTASIQLAAGARTGTVLIANGRRGSTMQTKTYGPFSLAEADALYDSKIKEKLKGGYQSGEDATPLETVAVPETGQSGQASVPNGRIALVRSIPKPMLLREITDAELVGFAADPAYWFQEKKDGNRILLEKKAGALTSYSRSGRETSALPKPIVEAAMAIPCDFLLDGEIVGDTIWTWDLLQHGGDNIRTYPYRTRYQRLGMIVAGSGRKAEKSAALRALFGRHGIRMVETATDHEAKVKLVEAVREQGGEGVTIKKAEAPYEIGRSDYALKYKFVATASVIVSKINTRRSVDMKLYDGTEVGSVTIPPNKQIPGLGSVIEIRSLYAHRGGSISQAVFLAVRYDTEPSECTIEQLQFKGEQR